MRAVILHLRIGFFSLSIGYLLLLGLSTQCLNAQKLDGIKDKKPIQINGGLSLNTVFYQTDQSQNLRAPFSWSLSGMPVVKLYGIRFPFQFTVTRDAQSFRQPFERYGVSPSYKWAKFHLGHRSLRYSPFTLNGKTFFGAGVELNPGGLRLSMMKGRLQQAELVDSLYQLDQIKYRRKAMAIKMGFGQRSNHIDFILMKAEDELSSIPFASELSGVSAEENFILGINVKQRIAKKVNFHWQGAASAYTDDQDADEIESNELDRFNFFRSLYHPNISSRINFAWETGLSTHIKKVGIKINYRRVEAGYQSMGANYIMDDVAHLTFGTNFRLWENKISFNGSMGLMNDNLNDHKINRTLRRIANLSLQFQPNQYFGLQAQYSNFMTDQQAGLQEVNDTIKVTQLTQNYTFSPRVLIDSDAHRHQFVWVNSLQFLNDLNPFTESFTEFEMRFSNLSWQWQWIDTGWSMTNSLNFNQVINQQLSSLRYGWTSALQKKWEYFSLRISSTLNPQRYDEQKNGYRLQQRCRASYQWNQHSLSAYSSYLNSHSILTESKKEFTGGLNYAFHF